MIGIIGAMEKEVALLRAGLSDRSFMTVAGMTFHTGYLEGKTAVIVQSGIGKVNAAIAAQVLADVFHVDAIINTGIAGGLLPDMKPGDIVLSIDTVQHDVDVSAFGYGLGVIPQQNPIAKADIEFRSLARKACWDKHIGATLWEGRICSGDQFVSDLETKKRLVEHFNGSCVEMEGAAIAQVASANGIPYLIIRTISDNADGSAVEYYDWFEDEAAKKSAEFTQALVSIL